MLTKRTNILFDQKTWELLVGLAQSKKTSVGALVREAVKNEHISKINQRDKNRERAHKLVLELGKNKKRGFTTDEILDYIHDGRKYE